MPPQSAYVTDYNESDDGEKWDKVATGLRFLLACWTLLTIQQALQACWDWMLTQSGTLVRLSIMMGWMAIVAHIAACGHFILAPRKLRACRLAQVALLLSIVSPCLNLLVVPFVFRLGGSNAAMITSIVSTVLYSAYEVSVLWFLLKLSEYIVRHDLASNLKIVIAVRVSLLVCVLAGATRGGGTWVSIALPWLNRGLIVFQLYLVYALFQHTDVAIRDR